MEMKHIAKSKSFVSGKLIPITLAVLMIISMVTIAFTANLKADAAGYELNEVPVAKSSLDTAHWVDATYFDYLSDAEMANNGDNWLDPVQAGTGYNGAQNNWYPFKEFNKIISANAGNWRYPLYLGNFCNVYNAYTDSDANHGGTHNGPYSEMTKAPYASGFNYFVNDSNGFSDYDVAVRGLVGNSLNSSGNLLTSSGTDMPYFNKSFLTSNKMAKVFDSKFPFRETPADQNNGVTRYDFNSTRGQDNVYFDWSGNNPTAVNYGGSSAGVDDGLKYFMKDEASGKGIFPFNRADGKGGAKNLDYGFGIRMDMDFKVPKDGKIKRTDNTTEDVKFTYSGDDDLWVYISNADGSGSKLVLDLGGDHKMAKGEINFATMQSKVEKYVNAADTQSKDAIFVRDENNWGSSMRIYAYNSAGASGWYKLTKDPRSGSDYANIYYVTLDSKDTTNTTPLSEMERFFITNGEDWASNQKAPSRCLFIKDTKGWGDSMKVWGWREGDQSGKYTGEWYDLEKYKDDIYYIKADAKGSQGHPLTGDDGNWNFIVAKNDKWDAQTQSANIWDCTNHIFDNATGTAAAEETLYEPKVSDSVNKVIYNNNLSYESGQKEVVALNYTSGEWEDFSIESKTPSSASKKSTASADNTLDPTKLYHMTIFYMERGLLESNCQMGFTMTPAQNFLEVTNQVNLTDLNPALVDPIKNGEKFDFTSTNTKTTPGQTDYEDDDPSYTDTINDPDSDPSYEHNGKERYDNKFKTGSDLHVSQKEETILKYDTTWNVVDKADNDKVIKKYDSADTNQDPKNTDLFTLVNKNPVEDANMQVNFINTPKVDDVLINKDIVTQTGADVTSDKEFTFKFNLTIPGLNSNAFPLKYYLVDEQKKPAEEGRAASGADYDVTNLTPLTMGNDGTFKLPANKAVLIKGLPTDAAYTISETDSGEYTDKTGTVNGTVGKEKALFFVNEEQATEPPTTEPPTTEPPTTEPPTTEPPTTEPPTTQPPTTEPPTTEPPTTEPPTTEPPTTEPPTTEPPTTEPPTTEPPTTEPPTTEPPTTEPPTTEPPTTVPPTDPVTEPPTTEPPKENEPKINKIISDSKFTPYYTTAAIGETVKFRLTATVTGSAVNKLNAYTIVDTMSDGLTFGKVSAVSLTGSKTLKLNSSQYKVTKTDSGFEVSLAKSVLDKNGFYNYKNVVVDCTAKLNKDAVIGAEGNPNEDSLKWTTADGKNHDKEGNEVVVYTFQIDVNKVDATTKDALEGCTFELYASASDAKKGENAIAKATSDEDGIASFVGLDGGKYYVKETKAVKGYNLNSKVYTVNIKPKFNSNGYLTAPEDGIVNTTIENTKPDVPKTGGLAGTIWFGAIGAGFLAAAGIILFFALRKKTTAK